MNIFVSVDLEGISGICRASQVMPNGQHKHEGRRLMTWDVNACVAGCIDGGAERIIVRDAHGGGFNLIWEDLDPRAEYIQGDSGLERFPDIASVDGLILLGYHAMGGTREAVLEHTMSSALWQHFRINGKRSGEVAIDAAIAGEHDVPVIMTSGDDKLCAEVRNFIPDIVAVEVKKGLACEGAQLLPKEIAHNRITDGAAEAVRKCKSIAPYKVDCPVTLQLELVSRKKVPQKRPGVTVIDGRTYEVTADTFEDAFNML